MRAAAVLPLLLLAALPPAFPQSAATVPGAAPPASPAAPAASGPARPDDLPKDSSSSWRVGITVFTSEGLSEDNTYLPFSLPLLLKNELAGLTQHEYAPGQADLARRFLVAAELTAAQKALTSARRDRDALLFNEVAAGDPAWAAARKKVEAAQARLAFLLGVDPSRVQVADRKPVSIVEGPGAGKLLDSPDVPPQVYCARQGLDLLVSGSVEEVQGYLLLDVWAFDPLSGRKVFSTRNAASRDELYASVPVFGREIARTILGRPWAMVAFAPQPPEAALYVDGVLAASGATPVLYLSPGSHEIRVQAPGYRGVTRAADFAEEGETRVDDSLEKLAAGRIEVASDPQGADLYVDSYWMGKTPLAVDRPAVRSRGVLTLEGFYDAPFSLGPASPEALSFSLQKDVGSKDVQRTRARDDFYQALGFFAFSLPLPAFSYGLSIDFAVKRFDLEQAGNATGAAQALSASQVFLGAYYAGIAVSAALFTWMVTRIVHYVSVANEIAN